MTSLEEKIAARSGRLQLLIGKVLEVARLNEHAHESYLDREALETTLDELCGMADEYGVRWLDDLAPAKRKQALADALKKARALVDEGKPLDAYVLLRATLPAYRDVKEGRKDATALMKKLSRDPAVKPEVAAAKQLTAFEKWAMKNHGKLERFAHLRRQAGRPHLDRDLGRDRGGSHHLPRPTSSRLTQRSTSSRLTWPPTSLGDASLLLVQTPGGCACCVFSAKPQFLWCRRLACIFR